MSLTKLNLKFKSLTSRVWRHHEASELLMKKPKKLRAALNKVKNLTRLLSSKKVQPPASFPAENEAVYPTTAAALASIEVCPGSTTLPISEASTLFDYSSNSQMTPATSCAVYHVRAGALKGAANSSFLLKKSVSFGYTTTIYFVKHSFTSYKEDTITSIVSAIPRLEESEGIFKIGDAADILECDRSFFDSESLNSNECSSLIGVTSTNSDPLTANSLVYSSDFVEFSHYPFDFTVPVVPEAIGDSVMRLSSHLRMYRVMKMCLFFSENRYIAEKTDDVEDSSNGFEVVSKTVVEMTGTFSSPSSLSSSSVEFSKEVCHDEIDFPHSHQPLNDLLDDPKESSAVNCVLRATVVVGGRCKEVSSEFEGATNSNVSTQSDDFEPQLISEISSTPCSMKKVLEVKFGLPTVSQKIEPILTPNEEDLKDVYLSETDTDSPSGTLSIDILTLTQSERRSLQCQSKRLTNYSDYKLASKLIRALKRDLHTADKTISRIPNAGTLKLWFEYQLGNIPEIDRSLFKKIENNYLTLETLWFSGRIPEELDSTVEDLAESAQSILEWHLSIVSMMNENGYTHETIKQMNSRANKISWVDDDESSVLKRSPMKQLPDTLVNKYLQRVIEMDY
ncbi:uncharacterized protein KQ657_001058 [Scheffersomyces spartinae]|uniref:Uncharacterized protein n=1 Tax=Scheffersomyces spartinae TaxID=45513 RepID=A0A9P7V838_9ASCO|nr:uncharacterized protein KQ657_001058 [Scheffersomyces spartinae]KAG7192953.1 hypothetical protein KQ657_001058 [Scheffersomyces spartinae]